MATEALRLAGDGAVLAARPAGTPHLYVGPLTRSGRYLPRDARPVCRARTGRLRVLEHPSPCSMAGRRVCARCSACLLRSLPGARQAEHPATRAGWLDLYAGTTKADVALALQLADTTAEVDAAAHLSLVLFDVAGTMTGFTEHGRDWPPLHQLVIDARGRVGGFPGSRDPADADLSPEARHEAAAERRKDRDDRIRRARRAVKEAHATAAPRR